MESVATLINDHLHRVKTVRFYCYPKYLRGLVWDGFAGTETCSQISSIISNWLYNERLERNKLIQLKRTTTLVKESYEAVRREDTST